MSGTALTEREREYLNCKVPMLSGGTAAGRIILGVLASMAQAVFSPSSNYGKADRGLMRTVREIRYTRYKKAVLRKQNGTPKKGDEKLLKKLNKKDFILAEDTYDPDEFTKQIYEEYLKRQEELRNRK
ncbi:MAG: hypothetical protein IJG87_04220 [Ruminococcus sp.]|nr:hypothetical protein [Ruminococcus sp.]